MAGEENPLSCRPILLSLREDGRILSLVVHVLLRKRDILGVKVGQKSRWPAVQMACSPNTGDIGTVKCTGEPVKSFSVHDFSVKASKL